MVNAAETMKGHRLAGKANDVETTQAHHRDEMVKEVETNHEDSGLHPTR